MYAKLRSKYPSKTAPAALDIGCGTGQLTRELFHAGFEVCGIDFSAEAIERAQQRTAQAITYIMGNFTEVALFPRDTYDIICCRLVWAFLDDKRACLQKVLLLLIPGGTLVLTLVDKGAIERKFHIASDIPKTEELLLEYFSEINKIREGHIVHLVCSAPKN